MDAGSLKRGDVREFTFKNGRTAVGIVVETGEKEDNAVLFIPALAYEERNFLHNSGIVTNRRDAFPGEGIIDIKDIKEAKIKRGLPDGLREGLSAGMNRCIQFRKGRALLEKLKEQQEELAREGSMIAEKARKAAGILSEEEFEKKILSSLSAEAQKSLSGYIFTEPCDVPLSRDAAIYMTKTTDTWLSARDMPFCYTEYDGNIFFKDNAEKNAKYKEILKKYHKDPRGIEIRQKESLLIAGGYNGRIYYQSYFEIPKPDSLTEQTARETAAYLQGKSRRKKDPSR